MPLKVRNKNQFKTYFDDNGRVCTYCGIYRSWVDFKPDKRVATKKAAQCKGCIVARRKVKGRVKERQVKKDRMSYLKIHEPFVWRSRSLRGHLLQRVKESSLKSTTPTAKDLQEWLESQPLVCYYSGQELSIYELNIDHKVPIIRGGTNEISNLCIASHHMNTAKGQMTDKEFKQLLKLIGKWEDGGTKLLNRLKQGHF